MPRHNYAPEHDAILKEFRTDQRLSFSQVARAMSRTLGQSFTREQVSGRCYRVGIDGPGYYRDRTCRRRIETAKHDKTP